MFGKWGRAYKFNLAANPRWVFFRLSGPIRVQKYEIRKEGSLLYNAKESAKVTTKSYRQCWKCLAEYRLVFMLCRNVKYTLREFFQYQQVRDGIRSKLSRIGCKILLRLVSFMQTYCR